MQALAGQEELLRNDAERQQQLAGVAASVEAFRTRVQHGLAEATFEQRRQLVLLLIDRVVVTDADVEIRYVLPTSSQSEHVRFCHLRKDYFLHPANAGREELAVTAAGDGLDGNAEFLARRGQTLAPVAEIAQGRSPEPLAGELTQHRDDAFRIVSVGRRDVDCQREAPSSSVLCSSRHQERLARYLRHEEHNPIFSRGYGLWPNRMSLPL